MKRIGMALVVIATLGAGTTLTRTAQAMPLGLSGHFATGDLNLIEKAQYIFGERNYCFYLNGWHGPGWYCCGYAFRSGFGWGGGDGWQGWHRGGGRSVGRRGGHPHGGGHQHHH